MIEMLEYWNNIYEDLGWTDGDIEEEEEEEDEEDEEEEEEEENVDNA